MLRYIDKTILLAESKGDLEKLNVKLKMESENLG